MKEQASLYDVIIIGGGLAGLTNAIHLTKYGKKVLLIEKNKYPKHKVCGEYISNEVLPYFEFLDINPFNFGAVKIEEFQLTTVNNNLISISLPLGGFGISRFSLDAVLANKARNQKTEILQDSVTDVDFKNDLFLVETKTDKKFRSKIVIGAYGKRSLLDKKIARKFMKIKAPYLAVKMHVEGVFQENLVALHNFKGGYCGVSKVENEIINLCYITSFSSFKKYKNIADFQEKVLFKNIYLKEIFKNSKPVFEAPLTISQISFETKSPVEKNIIMCGDSAGMIHPLCGNGMSMAIQSAQIASTLVLKYLNGEIQLRNELEKQYIRKWRKEFRIRLKTGHFIAMLFRHDKIAAILLSILKRIPFLLRLIIKRTHGKPIKV